MFWQAGEAARIGITNPIADIEHLLQESDVVRLRAVLYRDVDDMKQSQWIAMSVIYFVSVLMVSKYRWVCYVYNLLQFVNHVDNKHLIVICIAKIVRFLSGCYVQSPDRIGILRGESGYHPRR